MHITDILLRPLSWRRAYLLYHSFWKKKGAARAAAMAAAPAGKQRGNMAV